MLSLALFICQYSLYLARPSPSSSSTVNASQYAAISAHFRILIQTGFAAATSNQCPTIAVESSIAQHCVTFILGQKVMEATCCSHCTAVRSVLLLLLHCTTCQYSLLALSLFSSLYPPLHPLSTPPPPHGPLPAHRQANS